jgi:hypothetical protein
LIPYEVIVTSVHDRNDLLARTLRTMLERVDQKPARIIVNEDARADRLVQEGSTERILAELEHDFGVPMVLLAQRPGTGLARALLRLYEHAATEFVLYTQEDFDFVRDVPVARCLEIMQRHALNHVRFNKRNTLPIKGHHHPDKAKWWTKQEVKFDGQAFCVSDHIYFQACLNRRALLLEGLKEIMYGNPGGNVRIEAAVNHWFNTKHGGGCGSVDGNQNVRRDVLKTFAWGPVGEPRFILHTGAERRSQGWADPEHDRKHGTVLGEKR